MKYWTRRAQQLKEEDAKLLSKAPSHLQGLLKGKRLALWQELVDHFDYPDKRLVSDILRGFPITGWLPDSNIFPRDVKPPSMDVDTLGSLSKGMNAHVKAKVLASNSNDLAAVTWEETKKNWKKDGWQLTLEMEMAQHGPCALVCNRRRRCGSLTTLALQESTRLRACMNV